MAAERAMFTGVDAVMSGYDTFIKRYPWYALCKGNEPLWQGDDSDRDDLEMMLQAAEQSGNSDLFHLRFYTKDTPTPVTKSTPSVSAMIIRVSEQTGRVGSAGYGNNRELPHDVYVAFQAVKALPEAISGIVKRMEDLESSEPKEDGLMDKIGAFLSTPVGSMLLQRLIPGVPSSAISGPNARISGITTDHTTDRVADIEDNSDTGLLTSLTAEQDAELNGILDRLAAHLHIINDLNLLANLAEKQPDMFKMLLAQLRSMK